jgi:hypothetical protein
MKLQISISTLGGVDDRLLRARSQGYNIDKIWYHGSKNKFTAFDVKAEKANRGTNIAGIYLTPHEWEAQEFGDFVYSVYTRTMYPYIYGEKNKVTKEMIDRYSDLLVENTNYTKEWFDSAIAPAFLNTGIFKDIPGWIKQEVLVAGNYDSWQDGRHLCVFDPTMIRSVDAEFDLAHKNRNNLRA